MPTYANPGNQMIQTLSSYNRDCVAIGTTTFLFILLQVDTLDDSDGISSVRVIL